MTDSDILREVYDYCVTSSGIAEKFSDAPTLMVLDTVLDIIEGGLEDAHTSAVSDDQGDSR